MKKLATELAEKNEEINKLRELIELMKGEMARVHDSCSLMSHQEVWIRNVLRFAYNGLTYTPDSNVDKELEAQISELEKQNAFR